MSTKVNRVQLVGVLLLVGGMMFVMAVHIAELTFPGYSVSQNWFSDLGQSCRYEPTAAYPYYPHDCVFVQPAATIFNAAMVVLGAMLLTSAYLMLPVRRARRLFVLLGIAGVGCVGVGLVPEGSPPYHTLFSMLVFLVGAFAAIESFRFLPRPVGYISLVLASISLVAIAILVTVGGEIVAPTWTPLGKGGMERMTVYPELLWVMALGATLVALPELFTKPAALAAGASAPAERAPAEASVPGRSAKPPV